MAPHIDSPPPPSNPAPPDLNSSVFSKPQPLPPRSSSRSKRIRVQNRRREYLNRNPAYFTSSEHELADPLLYDTLIRCFLTPAEREADGRAKGYARVLEGSLLRGEERLARLAKDSPSGDNASGFHPTAQASGGATTRGAPACLPSSSSASGEVEDLPPPKTKEQGRERWEDFLRERFVRGEDEDFEYERVDEDEEFDVLERREMEEAWFDEESPEWVDAEEEEGGDGKMLTGETGVQDF